MLHLTINNGHDSSAQVLLEHPTIDISVVDEDGWNAVHFAAHK